MWFRTSDIDYMDKNFCEIFYNLVIKCPSVEVKRENKITVRKKVSKRGKSFYEKGITKKLLFTLNFAIKRIFKSNQTYIKIDNAEKNVNDERQRLIKTSNLSDPYFEFIIFKPHSNMSDTDTIYYYIRNAIAHGSFSIIVENNNRKIYLLHNENKGVVKAAMRLRESTLLKLIKYENMSSKDIMKLRKKVNK